MNSVVKFLVDYWQYISIALLSLFYLVSMFIKRRPMSLDEFQSVCDDMYRNLPYFVCKIENSVDAEGPVKKDLCIDLALDFVVKKLSRSLTDKEREKVKNMASWCIESILEAPTKKGGFGREKDE